MSALAGAASLDDAALVARCAKRDADAWRELVERYSRYVYAICVQAFGLSQEDAEDVFQDVFARTYERLADIRDPRALRPWLGQLTRRACIDRLRSQRREGAGMDDVDDTAVDAAMARIEEAVAVRQALAELSDDCREILDRFFCRDESYRTIGDAVGIPSGTIASRISRCLTRLRQVYVGRSEGRDPS